MAYLTGIYLRNFQSIAGPVFLQLDKLCLLYGPNSAGKSAIFDALDLIKKIVTLHDPRSMSSLLQKNLGSYSDQLKRDKRSVAFGIEFILPSKHEMNRSNVNLTGEFKRWNSASDSRGDYFHNWLFSELAGKKIQIEFADHFHDETGGIKIAVDGDPLFELTGASIQLNNSYEKVEHLAEGEYNLITGRLIIHKDNKFYSVIARCLKYFLLPLNPNRNADRIAFCEARAGELLRKLLIEEDENLLKIYGIDLAFANQNCFDLYTDAVNPHFMLDDVFFPDYEYFIIKSDNDKYIKFIQDEFDENTTLGAIAAAQKKEMYHELHYLSEVMNKIVTGFFHYINYAITNSHVKGSRQMLDSRDCLSYPNYLGLPFKDRDSNKNNSMIKYSEFLTSQSLKEAYDYYSHGEVAMRNDFINESLKKYLLSLKNYEIYTSYYNLSKSPDKNVTGRFIYLEIKDKKRGLNLGFQDVGSGISYIFPVLTSLWYSKLSFIEQPELHLHPSAQCELGDVFIAAYHKGSIAIAESHSEHILLRILRRIRETTNGYLLRKELKFDADNLRIYYFNPEPEGYTSVKEIRVDKHGELLNSWPSGFFSERDKELFGGFSPQRDKELFGE